MASRAAGGGVDAAPRLSAVGGTPARERTLRPQGRETLRRLLEAAIVVFDERGYHAARVDDIVRVAATSHGTFFLYFSSKEDLFTALLADVNHEMQALSESLPPIGPTATGYRKLRQWLARFFELYDHYHPVIRAYMASEPTFGVDRASIGAGGLTGFLRPIVQRLEEVDPPAVPDAETAGLAMVAMIERLGFYAVNQLRPLDREVMLDTVATILYNGLFSARRRRA